MLMPSMRNSWRICCDLGRSNRFRAQGLLTELETIKKLRKEARVELIKQSKKHPDYKLLIKTPGFGPLRVAQLLAWVGTPHRFRTKRQFWPYCGLAVITH